MQVLDLGLMPYPEAWSLQEKLHAEVVQGGSQDRQESLNPAVHPRLAQAEEFAHERLQGIGLQVNQQEQQLLPVERFS